MSLRKTLVCVKPVVDYGVNARNFPLRNRDFDLDTVLSEIDELVNLYLNILRKSVELDTVAISMSVEGVQGSHPIELDEVIAVDVIPVKPNAVPSSRIVENHPSLRGVDLHEIESTSVTSIIGANFSEALRVEGVYKCACCCPDAVPTPLGRSLLGPAFDSRIDVKGEVNLCVAHVGLHETMYSAQQARNQRVAREPCPLQSFLAPWKNVLDIV